MSRKTKAIARAVQHTRKHLATKSLALLDQAQPLSTIVYRQGYRAPDIRRIDLHPHGPLRAVRMAVFPGIMPMCRLGTSDRPLRAVRIDVTTPVRPADGRGVHVDRGERHGAKRERQHDKILRKIFHRFLLHLRQKSLV